MNYAGTAALLLGFGVAAGYAQPRQLNLTVSGSAAASTINLQPGTPASEYQLTGNGNLGPFTLRVVSAGGAPQQSSTCSGPMKLYIPVVAGGAVARFENGDLLTVILTGGNDCIDFEAGHAICTRVFQATGGTGRFNNASGGNITLIMTVTPALADTSNHPVFFTVTGAVTGTM
jgi:hypothetical protein